MPHVGAERKAGDPKRVGTRGQEELIIGAEGRGSCGAVVVHLEEARAYYLFRTQRYGAREQTSVYRSEDPLDFGVNDDRKLVCTLPVAAPEIVRHEGQWHIASLLPSLKGIRVARLEWTKAP